MGRCKPQQVFRARCRSDRSSAPSRSPPATCRATATRSQRGRFFSRRSLSSHSTICTVVAAPAVASLHGALRFSSCCWPSSAWLSVCTSPCHASGALISLRGPRARSEWVPAARDACPRSSTGAHWGSRAPRRARPPSQTKASSCAPSMIAAARCRAAPSASRRRSRPGACVTCRMARPPASHARAPPARRARPQDAPGVQSLC